jgi:hypothetical protein
VRRFARAVFARCAILSLALCLVALALWPLSHYRSAGVTYGKMDLTGVWELWIATDSLIIVRIDYAPSIPGFRYASGQAGNPDVRWEWQGLGFAVKRGAEVTIARLPLWFVAFVTALPPFAWGWTRRRRHRTNGRGFPVQQPAQNNGVLSNESVERGT